MHDVLIVGGGPSGSSLARKLCKNGLKVCLIEKTFFNRPRIGDFLPPEAKKYLPDDFNVATQNSVCLQTNEFLSCWGSSDVDEKNFIFSPFGSGLTLDRACFDEMLFNYSIKEGVDAYISTTVQNLSLNKENNWVIKILKESRLLTLNAKFLVFAIGRDRKNLFTLPIIKTNYDNLMGIGLHLNAPIEDNRPMIEACSQGWFYSNQLPNEKSILLWMTDTDLRVKAKNNHLELLSYLKTSHFSKKRFINILNKVKKVEIIASSAITSKTRPLFGTNWCLIGDCAQSFDPLSSQGLLYSFKSAELVSNALVQEGNMRLRLLQNYSEILDIEFNNYLKQKRMFYSLETRWKNSSFWRRRN